MERTKLTIRIPRELLQEAKDYARRHNTTLTRLVSAYLHRLSTQETPLADAPIVQRLSGVLSQEASVEDYRKYLEEKHEIKHDRRPD